MTHRQKLIENYIENNELTHDHVSQPLNYKNTVNNLNNDSQSNQNTFENSEITKKTYENCSFTHTAKNIHNTHEITTKTRSHRKSFTEDQILILEEIYLSDQYLKKEQFQAVAYALELTEKQVNKWFQNFRAKDKRKGIELNKKGNKGKKILEKMMKEWYNMNSTNKLVCFFILI